MKIGHQKSNEVFNGQENSILRLHQANNDFYGWYMTSRFFIALKMQKTYAALITKKNFNHFPFAFLKWHRILDEM